ncbi:MAG TPA: hypothetical protein VGI39_10330, partial [Polyangiaceae bacterium]
MKDRFSKLAELTRGAALVGIGLGAVACTTNTPPATTGSAAVTPDPAASTGGPVPARKFPVPNAV